MIQSAINSSHVNIGSSVTLVAVMDSNSLQKIILYRQTVYNMEGYRLGGGYSGAVGFISNLPSLLCGKL